jgi:hypothetical protein
LQSILPSWFPSLPPILPFIIVVYGHG